MGNEAVKIMSESCLSSAALSESVTCGGWNPGPVYTPLFSKQSASEKNH